MDWKQRQIIQDMAEALGGCQIGKPVPDDVKARLAWLAFYRRILLTIPAGDGERE